MSLSHSFPLFGNNPRFSELTVILFSFLTLTGCSHTYTPDQRARIAELATEFKMVCDLDNELFRLQEVNCELTPYSKKYNPHAVIDPAEIKAEIEDDEAERDCENSLEKRMAENNVPRRSLDAIVAERNTLGLTPWQGANWICSSRDDAIGDSKRMTEEGATISNGPWF